MSHLNQDDRDIIRQTNSYQYQEINLLIEYSYNTQQDVRKSVQRPNEPQKEIYTMLFNL